MGVGSKGLKFRNQFQETRERERGGMAAQTAEREIDGRQAGMAWQASPDLSVSISAGLPAPRERERAEIGSLGDFCLLPNENR